MSAQITTLLAVCDRLLAHVGQIKEKDGSVPATHWVPIIDQILDVRSILMKERTSTKKPTLTPTPTTTKP
jgi:hypothetical protein